MGVLVAMIGVAELAFSFARRAAQWRAIADTSAIMETEIRMAPDATAEQIGQWAQRYDKIATPPEPLFHNTHRLAENTAARRLGSDGFKPNKLSRRARLTRNILVGDPDD